MKKLEIRDFLGYSFLSDTLCSPDKKHIAFHVARADIEKNGYKKEIWVYDVAQAAPRKLCDVCRDGRYYWQDSQTLVYSDAQEEGGLPCTTFFELNLEGFRREKMRLPAAVKNILPLQDGSFAVVAAHRIGDPDPGAETDEQRTARMNERRENAYCHVVEEIPFWNNGASYVDLVRDVLYIYTPDDQRFRRISDEKQMIKAVAVRQNDILFAACAYDRVKSLYDTLYIARGGQPSARALTGCGEYMIRAVGFVNETPFFVGSDGAQVGMKQNPDIFAITPDGVRFIAKNDRGMGSSVGSDCRFPVGAYGGAAAVRVAGDEILILSTLDNDSRVLGFSLDGTSRELTAGGASVDCFEVIGNAVYAVQMTNDRLQELYRIENGEQTRLTGFNDGVHAQYALSVPERLCFESGGIAHEGFVIRPIGFDANKKYPAILEIHGGPKTVYGDVFYHEMQVMAARGYFVFFCNPRGSDGRGDDFAEIKGRWGFPDYDDIMAFTDAVLAAYPQIDSGRLGVTGGSYGGFMTNWIIGHTDRFRCAASQRSVSNWTTMFGMSDVGINMVEQDVTSDFWNNIETVWKHSPLKYAPNVKTPTLFIHAAQDYRCTLAEGMQMFTSLQSLGVETKLCVFEGENHELSRSGRPKHRIRRMEEIISWMDQHLMV